MIRKQLTVWLVAVTLLVCAASPAVAQPDLVGLAKRSGPAVVNIGTERSSKGGGKNPLEMFQQGMPPGFEKFFEQFERFQTPRQRKQRSLGSGFIISADGYIVTNNHVVEGADVIRVNLEGASGKNESIEAKLIGSDEETDIALLKVEVKHPLPFLRFGDSDKAQVGEQLMAIGNPFGLDHTVTSGILSAKGRNIHSGPFDNFLQTDASINPGNSGGPLLNMAGEVIGINTAIIASGQGIGFAIPSNMAAQITEQLKSGKKVRRGWLGVSMQAVDENTAKALGLPKAAGALVNSVMAGDPADRAGIKAGDVIIAINGKPVEDTSALLRAIAALPPNSAATVTVWRNGAPQDFRVTLGERNAEQAAHQGGGKPGEGQKAVTLGVAVRPLMAEEAKSLGMDKPEGLLVTRVEEGKPAAEAGLREGDVIVAANLTRVSTVAELGKIVQDAKARGAVMLQINRRGESFFRSVPLK